MQWETVPDQRANELLAQAIRLIINDPGRPQRTDVEGKPFQAEEINHQKIAIAIERLRR